MAPLSGATIRTKLGTLRTFFERTSEWGYHDAPTKVLIFNGDLPTPDAPLPKFLSDVEAGKLMRAAADADPTRRLVIEMLARTGLRVGELCALPSDAVIFRSGRHFSTNHIFNQVLETQRDHAAARDQHSRVDLFQMLINRNKQQAQA